MSKVFIATVLGLSLVAGLPVVYAQTSTTPSSRSAIPTPNRMIQPDEIRASKMIGSAVYDVQNRKIGSVAEVILNRDGKVDAVVIDVGSFLGMGGKNVAVMPNELKTDNNRLTLDRTKEQLQQMANYDLENRNTGAGTSSRPVTDLPGTVQTLAPPPKTER